MSDTYEPPRSVGEYRDMFENRAVSRRTPRPVSSEVARQELDTAYQVEQTIEVATKSTLDVFVLIAQLDQAIVKCEDRVLQAKLMSIEQGVRQALLGRLERYIGRDNTPTSRRDVYQREERWGQ
jgi:hypothetical protein